MLLIKFLFVLCLFLFSFQSFALPDFQIEPASEMEVASTNHFGSGRWDSPCPWSKANANSTPYALVPIKSSMPRPPYFSLEDKSSQAPCHRFAYKWSYNLTSKRFKRLKYDLHVYLQMPF